MKRVISLSAVAVGLLAVQGAAQTSDRSIDETAAYIGGIVDFEGSAPFGNEVVERLQFTSDACMVSMAATLREADSFVVGTISFNAADLFVDLVVIDDDDYGSGKVEIELAMFADAPDPTVEFFAPAESLSYERAVVDLQNQPDLGTCDDQGCTISMTLGDRTLPLLTPAAVASGQDVVAALTHMNALCMAEADQPAENE